MSAADAPVLREADSRVGRELCSLDLTDRCLDHLAKLLTLLFGDRSQEILNLGEALPHKSHDGNLGNAGNPGVANELKVERGEALGPIGIASTGGLPFEDSPRAIQLADGIDIGHEIIAIRESSQELFLHVLLGLANADAVISGKLLQEANPLGYAEKTSVSDEPFAIKKVGASPFLSLRGCSIECKDSLGRSGPLRPMPTLYFLSHIICP